MALEAVVFQEDPYSYLCKDLCSIGGGNYYWSYGFEEERAYTQTLHKYVEEACLMNTSCQSSPSSKNANVNSSSPEPCIGHGLLAPAITPAMTSGRRKRRRTKSVKNKEDVENQRMTHITVERNRRKQMNDYLSVLRSLMPASYGDQASIIGGAINFVKELEQLLQSLNAQKRRKKLPDSDFTSLFSDFFTFPQYSSSTHFNNVNSAATTESMAEKRSAIAEVEVTLVETHANLKIRTKRLPKQLLKIVTRLHTLHLPILHLNVTTLDHIVLYSISVKVEEDCQLTSVCDITTAVYEMVGRIQEEASFS
nr:basic helix-loop-helix transcription factor [Loropetalum chinense var. rubrum]